MNLQPLADLLGDRFRTDRASCEGYGVDWTGRYRGEVLGVARPQSTAEVSAILRHCTAAGIPVVPQGGNSGLVGGSVPQVPAVVVSTRGLLEVDDVDPVSRQVTVGAGVTLADVHRIARAAGFEYGVDLGARDSATIGGTVATNAGGINVVAFGMTRRQVVGIEAVLANGDVITSLRGLAKDNTGYDLSQLFCGSEGTLGVITKVRVQLQSPWPETTTAMVGVASHADAIALVNAIADGGARIKAAEIFDAVGLELWTRHRGTTAPISDALPLVLLVEFSGDAELPDDAVVAMDAQSRQRLWAVRESMSELIAHEGLVHKLDIAVPPGALDALWSGVHALLRDSTVQARALFGHLLDGNLHVAFVGPAADDERLDDAILELVARMRGTISAEHGIGSQKAQHLQLVRSAQEIAAMRAIKTALDPQGLLNPGVMFG